MKRWSVLNTERAYIWSLRVSTCQSSLFSKHFIGWKTMKVIQSSAWLSVCRYCFASEKWFYVVVERPFIAELSYSPTYQIVISPIPSIPDFVYTHFAQKFFELLMHVYTPVLHSICKACDNLRMRGRTSKSARNILNNVRTTMLGSFTLTFAWNRDCRRMVFKN